MEFVYNAEKIRFNSWEDFMKGTTNAERMKWCKEKAKTAKRARERIDATGTYRAPSGLSASDVWRMGLDFQTLKE